jgi:hypothetical protein
MHTLGIEHMFANAILLLLLPQIKKSLVIFDELDVPGAGVGEYGDGDGA